MQRSHAAKDVLDIITACLGTDGCKDYAIFRSRGLPPAECNSIAALWVDAEPFGSFGDCELMFSCYKAWDKEATLRIVLTRICAAPDQGANFNWQREDEEAACFDDALDLIEGCLLCNDWAEFAADHSVSKIVMSSVTHDVEADSGAFSAYIDLTMIAGECCPPPVP